MQSGRILIVDDDDALLKLMRAYLSRLGYPVDACRNSAEACALVQADPSAYGVALVDLNMPGMRGDELGRRILDASPSIRLVLVSGYPADLCLAEILDGQRVSFLHKPFNPKELAGVVGKIGRLDSVGP